MRLKTVPRQRKTNHPYEPANSSRGNKRSTDITQDVNKEFMNIKEYDRMLVSQKPIAKKYEMPGIADDSYPMELVTRKYVEDVNLVNDVKSSVNETFEALNLSTKNGFRTDEENETVSRSSEPEGTSSGNKFADSLLYQIMTDPTFVDNIKSNKEMKKLTCKLCKKKFYNYVELQDHLESRLNEFDRITCCACGKTFGQKRYLRYHQRCHAVNHKFTCDICAKEYSRMDNLTRHRTYHTNPDKFACRICSKTFSRRDLMTKHLKSHQGKKINCDFCELIFSDFGEMKAHGLAFHTAEQQKLN